MDIKTEKVGDITVVRLEKGKLLYDNLEPLHQGLYDLIDKGIVRLVLNLSTISYIDSFTVGFLMDIYRRLANQKGRLALAGVQPRVKNILALTRVDEVIPIYETVEEATASFARED
ncbi:anti-sigma F factor antagonist [bacterium (candidate division B38) B3_B38]|nr:MAG: anti-sigma F factor antagonist [bacterium (candidate division B38) B3_B38]